MIARCARAYVVVLMVIEILLLASSLLLHISVWMGARQPYLKFGPTVLIAALLWSFPVAFLARERNIWKNEFKRCPPSMQKTAIVLMAYGFLVAFCQIALFSDAVGPEDPLTLTAMPMFFEAIPLCILYAVLRSDRYESEVLERIGISFIVAVICATVFVVNHAGYHLHPG